MSRISVSALICLLTAAVAAGCADEHVTVEVTESRVAERPRLVLGRDTADRFAMFAEAPGGHAHGAGSSSSTNAAGSDTTLADGFVYELPAGWRELEPARFRDLNLAVADAQCYMTLLGGAGGGVAFELDNVNRWRGQLGLSPIDLEAYESLPDEDFLGFDAKRIDLSGRFAGGMGSEPIENARLVGVIKAFPKATLTLKFIGPSETVTRELERFDAFLDSLRFRQEAPSGPDSGAAPSGGGATGELTWDVPDGWTIGLSTSSMRTVTVHPGGDESIDCYITILGGAAGGLVDNINRWAGQMGHPPFSPQEITAMPKIDVLGAPASLVELTGKFGGGMGAQPIDDAAMLGVVVPFAGRTVFVKMVGPRAETLAAKDGFVAFCKSLEVE